MSLFYSNADRISPLIFAFPPEGVANVSLHTLHVTLFDALLNTNCSLPHFKHLTRRKLLLGFGISLFHSDITFYSIKVFKLGLVFVAVFRLCAACNCILYILNAKFAFWLFLQIHVAVRISAHRNLAFLVRGDVRHALRLYVYQPCIGLQCELDELYISDSKS